MAPAEIGEHCQICRQPSLTRLVVSPWGTMMWVCQTCADRLEEDDRRNALMPPEHRRPPPLSRDERARRRGHPHPVDMLDCRHDTPPGAEL